MEECYFCISSRLAKSHKTSHVRYRNMRNMYILYDFAIVSQKYGGEHFFSLFVQTFKSFV